MKKIVMNEKINHRKTWLISLIGLLFLLLHTKVVSAQDIIRLQLKDSIVANVLEVTPRFIKYTSDFDSIEHIIKPRKVLEVKYHNGTLVHISKNRWDNFYRPSIYFINSEYEGDMVHGSYEEIRSAGLGHKGLFRLPLNGFGIIYYADIGLGHYHFLDSITQSTVNNVLISMNFSAGVEYRYSFIRGFGLFTDIQTGKSFLRLYKKQLNFNTPDLVYTVSIGAYFSRLQGGLRYSWGKFIRQSDAETADGIPLQKSQYKLSNIQIFTAYVF